MNNSKDFLKDIGLATEDNPILKTNLLPFISLRSGKMDETTEAIYKHVRNLVNTYGEDSVFIIMEAAVEELKNVGR